VVHDFYNIVLLEIEDQENGGLMNQ